MHHIHHEISLPEIHWWSSRCFLSYKALSLSGNQSGHDLVMAASEPVVSGSAIATLKLWPSRCTIMAKLHHHSQSFMPIISLSHHHLSPWATLQQTTTACNAAPSSPLPLKPYLITFAATPCRLCVIVLWPLPSRKPAPLLLTSTRTAATIVKLHLRHALATSFWQDAEAKASFDQLPREGEWVLDGVWCGEVRERDVYYASYYVNVLIDLLTFTIRSQGGSCTEHNKVHIE